MLGFIRSIHLPLFASIISTCLVFYYEALIVLVFIFLLDMVGRGRDYDKLKEIRSKNMNMTKSLWNNFSVTRCSREVMIAVDPEAKEYYKLVGYRWYHFLPDGTFTRESPFLNWKMMWNLSKPRYRK